MASAGLPAILLLHHLERHLAGAEAGHLHGARHFLQALLDVFFDLRHRHRHVDAALQGARAGLAG
jgi:hypothetical protein